VMQLTSVAAVGSTLTAVFANRLRSQGRLRTPNRIRIESASWGSLVLLTVLTASFSQTCMSAWFRYGLSMTTCPDGNVLQSIAVSASGLRRGGVGPVVVSSTALFTTGEADDVMQAPISEFEVETFLVKPDGKEVALLPEKPGWLESNGSTTAQLKLPAELPDGDYTLRTRVRSEVGINSIDAPLPLFAPARIHLITDRPLYEPGHTVQFRAVVVRATDLVPLDGRPGKWIIDDPSGEVVLEEKAPAGAYGVVAGSFPLDDKATQGDWHLRWSSGNDGKGERPLLHGRVVYASGAPVSGAQLEMTWSIDGDWPPPGDWIGNKLPQNATANKAGVFELNLPVVPDDLRGKVTLTADVVALDAAGDRVAIAVPVLLSEDAIEILPQTELAGGLVEGFNNRLFLRATSAAGAVLPATTLHIRRAWDATDPGVTAVTDDDGVAVIQIDPGPAVNVVVPPMPHRPSAPPPAVGRGETLELISLSGASLADQLEMDRWNKLLIPCSRYSEGEEISSSVALRVATNGAVTASPISATSVDRCVASTLFGRKLSPGFDRLYKTEYKFQSKSPWISLQLQSPSEIPSGLKQAIRTALWEARRCLPERMVGRALPRLAMWNLRAANRALSMAFVRDPSADGEVVPASVSSCIEREVARVGWADVQAAARQLSQTSELVALAESGLSVLGSASFFVYVPADFEAESQPQATVRTGYELSIAASRDGQPVGDTRIVIDPGKIPLIRLRATPVMAEAGGKVTVALLRGPAYAGSLPETLRMAHRHGTLEAKLDREGLTAEFKLPADARGWFEVNHEGARALVYVRPADALDVSVTAAQPQYRPGQTVELQIQTAANGKGTSAAVGLFGVDATMAQLAPLPGPDDMVGLRTAPIMKSPAFGALDATALQMGRIRGGNAAAATVLQIERLAEAASTDAVVSTKADQPFEPPVALTDNFYRVLDDLHRRVRTWETSAPRNEKMRPVLMGKMWYESLAACEARKEAVVDAFGRLLKLHRLPADLLALIDPRQLVMDGTRLPEDVENWSEWVMRGAQ
jgi:hypothetical protein